MSKLFEEKTKILIKEDIDDSSFNRIKKETEKFLELFKKKFGASALIEFKVEIRQMRKQGSNKKYEIKIELISDFRNFSVKRVGWNIGLEYKYSIEAVKNQFQEFNE